MEKVYSVGDKVKLHGYLSTKTIIKIENSSALIEYSDESRAWKAQSELSPVIDLINREDIFKFLTDQIKKIGCSDCSNYVQRLIDKIEKMESISKDA